MFSQKIKQPGEQKKIPRLFSEGFPASKTSDLKKKSQDSYKNTKNQEETEENVTVDIVRD